MPDTAPGDTAAVFSVVIPIHNEAAYLEEAVPALAAEMATVPVPVDVTLVENGSTDDTADVAKRLVADHPRFSVVQLPTPDYGAAMRAGFLAAQAPWVVNFDIDYFSARFLSQALDLADDADVVLASKRAPGSQDRRSAFRRLATWGFNLLLRGLLGSGVSDTHGMKAVRADVVAAVVPDVVSNQDLFDTELVIRAERAGYRIREVPVRVEEQREAKSSLWRRIPRTVRGMLTIRQALRGGGPRARA